VKPPPLLVIASLYGVIATDRADAANVTSTTKLGPAGFAGSATTGSAMPA